MSDLPSDHKDPAIWLGSLLILCYKTTSRLGQGRRGSKAGIARKGSPTQGLSRQPLPRQGVAPLKQPWLTFIANEKLDLRARGEPGAKSTHGLYAYDPDPPS